MTCCKFATGCYLNCDFENCKSWCRKLDFYRSKVCRFKEKLFGQKKNCESGNKKSNHGNLLAKRKSSLRNSKPSLDRLENRDSLRKNTSSSIQANKFQDAIDDEDEEVIVDDFCKCDFPNDPTSYVSFESNQNLVNKTRETVCSMANIIHHMHKCFDPNDPKRISSKIKESGRKSASPQKSATPPIKSPSEKCVRLEKANVESKIQKHYSGSEGKTTTEVICCKRYSMPEVSKKDQQATCQQISMSALMNRLKQGISTLSPEEAAKEMEDSEKASDDKRERIEKCKLLENLKDGVGCSTEAAKDRKHCILLDKICCLKNTVVEVHQKLTSVVPKVCITFDRANRTLSVRRGRPNQDVKKQ